MEKALWYLFVGTRGGKNRARLIDALTERPQNANQLSEALDLEYNTIRYHLEKLVDHGIVETGGDDYGELYFLTDRFERHREEFDRITERIED
jgi:DNA-binding transcriptional ArsR family regulator